MPSHRRGRSLSEGFKLEESEEGALIISSIDDDSSTNQGLKEGDEIVGAAINFDELSIEDVLKVLRLMEPFNENVQVLTKNNFSKSLSNLDKCPKRPEEMLMESYNRLYNAKIKKFMKDDSPGAEGGCVNGGLKFKQTIPDSSKFSLKDDTGLPRLGVDFGVMKTNKRRTDVPIALESGDITFSTAKTEALGDANGGSLPLSSPGLDLPADDGTIQVPRLNVNARSSKQNVPDLQLSRTLQEGPDINNKAGLKVPNVDLKMPNLERPQIGLESNGIFRAPDIDTTLQKADLKLPGIDLRDSHVSIPDMEINPCEGNTTGPTFDIGVPKVDIEGTVKKFKMPKYKLPDLGLSGPTLSGPDCDVKTPDISAPDVPSGKIRVRSSQKLKNPDLNVDDPSSYVKLRNVRLSGLPRSSDIDLDVGVKTPNVAVKTLSIDAPGIYLPNVKLPSMKDSQVDCKIPDADIKMPGLGILGQSIKSPDFGLETLGLVSVPQSELPDCNNPNFRGPKHDLNGPDVDMPSGEVTVPCKDLDVDAPNGKVKMPKFGLTGRRPDLTSEAGFKTPNLSVNTPKIKSEIDVPGMNLPKVDLKAPELDIYSPGVDIKAPSGKFKVPKLTMPNCDLSGAQGPGINGDLKGPDVSLVAPKFKTEIAEPYADINVPSIDLKQPNLDIGSPSGKLKRPGFKMPDLGFSGPKIQGPDYELKAPDLDLSAPRFKKGFNPPDMNLPVIDLKDPKLDPPDMDIHMPSGQLSFDADASSGKLKMPNFKLFGTLPKKKDVDINAGVKTPNLTLTSPKIKGIDAPDMNAPNMDLKAPNLHLHSPDVNFGSPKGKFKMPKLKMPSFDLSGPKGPHIDIDGDLNRPDIRLQSSSLNVDLSKPEFDIDAPSLNLKGPKRELKLPDADIGSPSGKFKMPSFKMPDFGLSGPNLKGPDGELKTPDFDLSAPIFKGAVGSPDLNLPEMDLNQHKLDLTGPDVKLNMPSGKFKVPALKKPNIDLNAPDMNIDNPSGKFTMPKFGLSGTLPKGHHLDMNTDMKTPAVGLKAPKMKGRIDTPNLDLKAPNIDVRTPDVNFGSPKAKFKMPKLKMPKFNLPSLKWPDGDIHGDLEGPDIDIKTPHFNVKGPKAGLEMPDANFGSPSGKFNKPNLKIPDFGLSGPKFDSLNFDLKSPDLDISGSKLSGGITPPDLNMPKVDLKNRKLDLNTPNVNLDIPGGKFKIPTLTKPTTDISAPNFDIDAPLGKLKMPKLNLSGTLPEGPNFDINSDLKTPDFSLKTPKMKGRIDAPDLDLPNMDLKAPKLDVNTPNVNIDSPKARFRMPKLKMPKFSFPSLKGPDIDSNLNGPDVDINAPNVNLKGSKAGFEIPDVDFGSLSEKLKKPNLKMHDVGFSGPKLDGPNFDFKSPDLGATLPKGPNLNINTDLKRPDLSLSAPKIKGRINTPDMDLPNMNLTSPKLDVNTPDVNIGSPNAKFKIPKLKMPKFDISSPNCPNVDIDGDLQCPDLNIPNVDIDVNAPSSQMKMPQMPTFGLSGSLPKGGIDTPNLSIKAPNLRGSIDSPDLPAVDIGAPAFDVGVQDMDIGSPSGKFKVPKFEASGIKRSGLGMNGNIDGPDINFIAHKAKSGIRGPGIDMNVPSGNNHVSQTDLDFPDRKLKLPSFKLPQFGSSDLNRTGCDIDFGAPLRAANRNISHPIAKPNVKTTDLKGDFTGPKVSSTNVELSMPKADIRSPQFHPKAPEFDIDAPSLKYKGPSHKNRRSDITGANVKMPVLDLDADVKMRHTDRKSAKTKTRSSYPFVDSDLPKIDSLDHNIDFTRADLNIDDFTGKDHVLRARGSKLDLIMTETPGVHSGPNLKASFPSYGISSSGTNFDVRDHKHHRKIPAVDVDVHSKHQSARQPVIDMHLPKLSKDSKRKSPDNTDGYYVTVFPKQAQNGKMPNRKYNTIGGRVDFNPSNVDLEVPDANDLKGSTFFFSNLI